MYGVALSMTTSLTGRGWFQSSLVALVGICAVAAVASQALSSIQPRINTSSTRRPYATGLSWPSVTCWEA